MDGKPYGGHSGGTPGAAVRPPASVQALRVLLYVLGGLHIVTAIGLFAYSSHSAEVFGRLFVFALPGIASVVLAVFAGRGGRLVWWCIIALQVAYVLISLGRVGGGSPGGLIELCFPIAVLILATRPRARHFFRGKG